MEEHLGQPLAASCDEALKTLSTTINKRQWHKATRQAANITHHWPHSLQAWKQRYLVALLLNDMVGATECSDVLHRLPGFSDVDLGDMLRDQVLSIVRNHAAEHYHSAAMLITQAERLHAGDANRQYCLMGASGRLQAVLGNNELALRHMIIADRGWAAMGKSANKQWRYNNWVHLQRLLVGTRPASRLDTCARWIAGCHIGLRLAIGLPGAKWTPKHAGIGLAAPILALTGQSERFMR